MRRLLAVLLIAAGCAETEVDSVFGTFEGEVSLLFQSEGAPVPRGIAKGDRVLGCFRYRAELATPQPHRSTPGQTSTLTFPILSRDAVFAVSIGERVWRATDGFEMKIANGHPLGPLPGSEGSMGSLDRVSFHSVWEGEGNPPLHPGLLGIASLGVTVYDGERARLVDGTEPPRDPDDLDLTHARLSGGIQSMPAYGHPGWGIMFEGHPVSLRINGTLVPSGADDASGTGAAAARACALPGA